MAKGKLIIFDGGDGAGKHTQSDMLVQRLIQEGRQVGTLDFPRLATNTFGKLIRECLDGKRGDFLHLDPYVASVLFAADRFESKKTVTDWLEEGRLVIVDRYVSSNMLHQGSKIKDESELKSFISWLEHVEYDIFGMPRPDLHIYFQIDPEERIKMLQHAADKRENVMDLAETNLQHQKETDETAKRIIGLTSNWISVECMGEHGVRTREDIHEEVYDIVEKYI